MKMKKRILFLILPCMLFVTCGIDDTKKDDDLAIVKDINEFDISNMREFKGDDSKTVETNHNQITQDNLEATLAAIEGTYIFKESDGTEGCLRINKNEDGSYDLNDSVAADGTGIYANSSNIERADDNRLFIKYPKTVYDDGDAVFEFYIWQIQDNEIQVYYSPNSFDDTNYLYTARMDELSKIKASFQGKYILDKNDLASIYDTRTAVDNAANFEGDWKSIEVEGTHSGDITISNQTNEGFHFDGVFFYHHGGIEKDDAPNVGDASGVAYFVNEHLAICSTLTDTEYGGIDNAEGYAVFYLSDGHLYITTEGTVGCMGGMITMNGEYSLE